MSERLGFKKDDVVVSGTGRSSGLTGASDLQGKYKHTFPFIFSYWQLACGVVGCDMVVY